MRVSDFNYDLPEELIAQSPPAIRGSSRMLVLDKATGAYQDNFFRNLPEILRPGDLLILNDSRVIPARLYATRAGLHTQHNSPDPTGRIEVLLTQQLAANDWTALVRPSRKVQPGEHLLFHAPDEPQPLLEAEILAAGEFGERPSARLRRGAGPTGGGSRHRLAGSCRFSHAGRLAGAAIGVVRTQRKW